MKKIWWCLLSWTLVICSCFLNCCIAKFELTELFQSTKNVDTTTDEINHLVEMNIVDDINNKNKINFDTIDFLKVLNFFLKQGKDLKQYIILTKKPTCYAEPSLKNKKAIHIELQHTDKQNSNQLAIQFYLTIYCVWKKTRNMYTWERTSLNKIIMLIIKSDQTFIF